MMSSVPAGLEGELVQLHSFEVRASDSLVSWLAEGNQSLLISCGNRLWVIGVGLHGLAVAERTLDGAGPICLDDGRLLVASRWQIWTFVEVPVGEANTENGAERTFLPQLGQTIGAVGIADLLLTDGIPVFASSAFSCLARTDGRLTMQPVWAPPWISALRPENRCGLRGMAPRARHSHEVGFVTCSAATDRNEAWKTQPAGAGVVVSIEGDIVTQGLDGPMSPRWYGEKLLVVNQFRGQLIALDVKSGQTETVLACHALLGPMAVSGHMAVVGASDPRASDIELRLDANDVGWGTAGPTNPRSGVLLVDLGHGMIAGSLEFLGRVGPIEGVAIVPSCRSLMVAAPRGSTSQHDVVIAPSEPLLGSGWEAENQMSNG
jgi:uncharacterized protein (TIGR03032 family)